jgi:hypothetical protein
MTAGYVQWPFAGGPAAATYPQLVLMVAARRQAEEPQGKRKLPKRMWQDWLKRTGHDG